MNHESYTNQSDPNAPTPRRDSRQVRRQRERLAKKRRPSDLLPRTVPDDAGAPGWQDYYRAGSYSKYLPHRGAKERARHG